MDLDTQVNNGTNLLADYVFLSKYSQKKSDGNLENWNETVDRIYRMHKEKLSNMNLLDEEVSQMFKKAISFENSKYILSSQRGRQFASSNHESGILKHEAKIYNCCSTYIDRIEVFSEIMYLLLCGCGVGYSLHNEYINKLPIVKPYNGDQRPQFFVEDSIEGWADSILELITSLFEGKSADIVFDAIRPKGSLIDGKFIAPGANPLIKAHNKIKKIFSKVSGRKLKTIELHDIICCIAEGVMSGGIRRSAMIALFDKDDKDMLSSKTGEWYKENPQRAMANNSILTTKKDSNTYDELKNVINTVKQFGEPGFINVKDYSYVVNPCAEITMKPYYQGKTGFAFCNLVEINASILKSEKEFYEVCEIASFVATVQALYTKFKYLSKTSEYIAERDRAIGVSITGIYSNKKILNNGVLKRGAKIIKETNSYFSDKFKIQHSGACTTVKPSGNASSILGLTCSGIHPAHAHKYLRRVRIKTNSPEFLSLENTPMIKKINSDDAIISFPIECDDIVKDQVSAIEHLKFISRVKHYWINKGKRSWAESNNISATVEVKEDEWVEVAAVLFSNDYLFTGVSLLPKLGDSIYPNAPFSRLSSEELVDEFYDIKDFIENNEINFNKIMSGRGEIFSGDMVATGCSGGACSLE